MKPLVSVNLVFHKDRSFFEPYLNSLKNQSYTNIETNILDTRHDNIGFWAGQEKLLKQAKGKYIICMSDVFLDKDFIKNSVDILEKDATVGAVQAKILTYGGIIDTTGFQIFPTRRIINRGKQEWDVGQYPAGEIFAVEGAVPVFRKQALEDCKMPWLIDPDYRIGPYGYGDDLDLTWRMSNLGWKQWYDPKVIAYHDRSTSGPRSSIPLIKRQLDWCNVRFTIIKNDSILNLVKYAPFWIFREVGVLIYSVIFEISVLKIIPRFFKLLPCMLRRRKRLMKMMKFRQTASQSLDS